MRRERRGHQQVIGDTDGTRCVHGILILHQPKEEFGREKGVVVGAETKLVRARGEAVT